MDTVIEFAKEVVVDVLIVICGVVIISAQGLSTKAGVSCGGAKVEAAQHP